MSPLLRSGLATSQDRIRFHAPAKGSLWLRRQPRTRFLRSCSRYKVSSPAAGSGTLPGVGSVLRKRRGEGWKGEMREKENNRQHSRKQPVATARVGQTGGWGQVRERPRAVPAASRQVERLIGAIVAGEFSLDRRRSALSSTRAVWRAISSKAGDCSDCPFSAKLGT